MQFKRLLQNVFLMVTIVLLGLLFMISRGLTQPGIWVQKVDLPTARCYLSSCELNGKIYVIGGGQSNMSSLNTIEVYDIATNTWDITKADMPTSRVEFCLCAVNGKIYAIGGASAHVGTVTGKVEEYDPLTDSWDTNKSPMPTPRQGAACGVIDDKIYVAGGTTGPLTSWKYMIR
jgi:N-acetylneuraminic acid mutarotase